MNKLHLRYSGFFLGFFNRSWFQNLFLFSQWQG